MLLSYGNIIGHEVVFGHHTSAEVNCHTHSSDSCDHHGDHQNHIPCNVDINPHFASGGHIIVPDDEGFEFDLGFYFIADLLIDDVFPEEEQEVLPYRVIPDNYSSSFHRSHGLRGPPLV